MSKYPAIPQPSADVAALHKSVAALKETVEILTRQREDRATGPVSHPGAPLTREQLHKYGSYEELRDAILNGHD